MSAPKRKRFLTDKKCKLVAQSIAAEMRLPERERIPEPPWRIPVLIWAVSPKLVRVKVRRLFHPEEADLIISVLSEMGLLGEAPA